MTKKINMFVSSKMGELRQERNLIYELFPDEGGEFPQVYAWRFEADAPASEKSIRDIYLNVLRHSGLYLGLFWNEYGEWTIDEFERAGEWGIPRHIYVKNVNSHQRDPQLEAFLIRTQNVTSGITHKWFSTDDELKEAIRQSLSVWLGNRFMHHIGSSSAIIANTPDDLESVPRKLIGREALLEKVQQALDMGDRVLLQGLGGMGKTALATTFAANWLYNRKGDVMWLVAGSETSEHLFDAIARPSNSSQSLAQASDKALFIRQLLSRLQISLVVIDDAWDGAELQKLLKAIPRSIAVVVTSRQRYPLDILIDVGELTPDKSLETLSYFARQDLSADPIAADLCKLLGYHAYALEIAGSMLKTRKISPAELLSEIALAPADALKMPTDFVEERRENVGKLLEVSIQALDHPTQTVLYAFGAFFSPSATLELLTLYTEQPLNIIEPALAQLEASGLLKKISGNEQIQTYYELHDLTYSYVRVMSIQEHKKRALNACVQYSHLYHQPKPNHFAALQAELNNLLGASQWALVNQHYSQIDILVSNLYSMTGTRFLDLRAFFPQSIMLLQQALTAAERRNDLKYQSRYHGYIGYAHYLIGQYEPALSHYQEALRLSQASEDLEQEATWTGTVARVYRNQGKNEEAVIYFKRSIDLNEQLGDNTLENQSAQWGSLGTTYSDLGNFDEAAGYYQNALKLAQSVQNHPQIGNQLSNLSFAYLNLGRYEEALSYGEKSIEIIKQIGARRIEGYVYVWLGKTHLALKNYDTAHQFLSQALQMAVEMQTPLEIHHRKNLMAYYYLRVGNLHSALESIVSAHQYHFPHYVYITLSLHAIILLRLNTDLDKAKTLFTQALAEAQKILTQTPDLHAPKFMMGLIYAGLALLNSQEEQSIFTQQSKSAYDKALQNCRADGVVQEALELLRILAVADLHYTLNTLLLFLDDRN